jgi:hypothetical protein
VTHNWGLALAGKKSPEGEFVPGSSGLKSPSEDSEFSEEEKLSNDSIA